MTLDALVLSGGDAGERYLDGDIEPPPLAVIRTSGAEGGTITQAAGERAGRPRRCPARGWTRTGPATRSPAG